MDRLSIEELQEIIGNEQSIEWNGISKFYAQQLLDTMRENERLKKEILSLKNKANGIKAMGESTYEACKQRYRDRVINDHAE